MNIQALTPAQSLIACALDQQDGTSFAGQIDEAIGNDAAAIFNGELDTWLAIRHVLAKGIPPDVNSVVFSWGELHGDKPVPISESVRKAEGIHSKYEWPTYLEDARRLALKAQVNHLGLIIEQAKRDGTDPSKTVAALKAKIESLEKAHSQ